MSSSAYSGYNSTKFVDASAKINGKYEKRTNMLDLLYSYLDSAWQVVASIGWYLVGALVVSFYLSPYILPNLKKKYNDWKRKKDDSEYAAKYHKDPDVYQDRLARMEAARQRMQEKYIRDAEIAKQKELERIEKKRQDLLDLTEGKNVGQKLGFSAGEASTSSSKPGGFKQEYNPLMGDNSRGYRAPKRSCCGKGGCG